MSWPFKLSFHIDNPEIILYCPFELSFQIDKLDMILYWLLELSFHIDNPDMILYWPFRLSLPYCLSIHNHLVTLRASSSILMVLTWSCTNLEYYNVIYGFQLRMYLCELGLGQVHLIVLFLQQILQIFNLKAAMNETHSIWRQNRVEFISTSFYSLSLLARIQS